MSTRNPLNINPFILHKESEREKLYCNRCKTLLGDFQVNATKEIVCDRCITDADTNPVR